MKLVISRTMAAVFATAKTIPGGTAVAAELLPEDANTKCPVMRNEPIDAGLFVDYEGKRIYLCCTKYKRQFLKDPEKYINPIKSDDFETVQPRIASQSSKR